MRFLQLDNNVCTGELIASSAPTILPQGRTFIEWPDDQPFPAGGTWDPEQKTMSIPEPVEVISLADVIAGLTPQQWADLNASEDVDVQHSLALLKARGHLSCDRGVDATALQRLRSTTKMDLRKT